MAGEIPWEDGPSIVIDGEHPNTPIELRHLSVDVVHATKRVSYWGDHVRHVLCVGGTFGPAAGYLQESPKPANCMACIAARAVR